MFLTADKANNFYYMDKKKYDKLMNEAVRKILPKRTE